MEPRAPRLEVIGMIFSLELCRKRIDFAFMEHVTHLALLIPAV